MKPFSICNWGIHFIKIKQSPNKYHSNKQFFANRNSKTADRKGRKGSHEFCIFRNENEVGQPRN